MAGPGLRKGGYGGVYEGGREGGRERQEGMLSSTGGKEGGRGR